LKKEKIEDWEKSELRKLALSNHAQKVRENIFSGNGLPLILIFYTHVPLCLNCQKLLEKIFICAEAEMLK
jgi:hypothetical protein